MSFGKMTSFVTIKKNELLVDDEGFSYEKEIEVAKVRAYKEGKHGSKRWFNMAQFTEATDLFKFRKIPGIKISENYFIVCNDEKYTILSVQDVREKGMYIEILAKKVEPIDG